MTDGNDTPFTETQVKAWLESPEGIEAIAKLNENARVRKARSTPGTPEYYAIWKAQRDATEEWDKGPFI